MIGLNRIKRTHIIAFVNRLAAVLIGNDNVIIFRPWMPGLADFQRALITLNGNVPFHFSVNGTVQMRVKSVIGQYGLGFGVSPRRSQPRFAAQAIGFADEIARRGERVNADIENAATGAVNIIKPVLRREGKGKTEAR